MRQIKQHIIHCSDSTFGDVDTIRQWHLERGFKDIGYHYVILRDGTLEQGRQLHQIGAHCKGNNRYSVGTCLIGKEKFTPIQFRTLRRLHRQLKEQFPELTAHGHCEFNPRKTCPNFNVRRALK